MLNAVTAQMQNYSKHCCFELQTNCQCSFTHVRKCTFQAKYFLNMLYVGAELSPRQDEAKQGETQIPHHFHQPSQVSFVSSAVEPVADDHRELCFGSWLEY